MVGSHAEYSVQINVQYYGYSKRIESKMVIDNGLEAGDFKITVIHIPCGKEGRLVYYETSDWYFVDFDIGEEEVFKNELRIDCDYCKVYHHMEPKK